MCAPYLNTGFSSSTSSLLADTMVGGVYMVASDLALNKSGWLPSAVGIISLVSSAVCLVSSCVPFSSDRPPWWIVLAVGKAAALKLAEIFLRRPMAIADERG